MRILDALFGKKRIIKHPILGILISGRIKGNDKTKTYSWYGEITLNNKSEKTIIIMEGNHSAPYYSHLNFISQLVEKWESKYFIEIEKKLVDNGINDIEKYSNWKNDFYVGAITPMDERKAEFELTFEALNSENTNYIGIDFKNNTITKIEFD